MNGHGFKESSSFKGSENVAYRLKDSRTILLLLLTGVNVPYMVLRLGLTAVSLTINPLVSLNLGLACFAQLLRGLTVVLMGVRLPVKQSGLP